MKIKNLFLLSSLIILGTILSGFIKPNTPTVPISNSSYNNFEKLSFPDFLSYFKKTELPYQMDLKDFKKYKNFQGSATNRLNQKATPNLSQLAEVKVLPRSKYIPESATGLFSRMGPPIINPLVYFYPNKNSVAVVYTAESRFSDKIRESYRLVVYDLKGNIVFPKNNSNKSLKKRKGFRRGSSFELGQSSINNTVTFQITKDGQIWKRNYLNMWKEDLKEKPFYENELMSFKLEGTEVLVFDEKGIAEKLKTLPTDARASLD